MNANGTGSPDLYIIVRNWRRFQHYSGRNPPWIKNLTQLLHDHNYLDLPGDTRAILHGLWLEYASANCQLRLSTRSLTRRLNLRVTRPQLDSLVQAGFIEYSLAPRLQDASTTRAREEAEAETKKEASLALPYLDHPPSKARQEIEQNDDFGGTA